MEPLDALRLILPYLKDELKLAPDDHASTWKSGDGYTLSYEDLELFILAAEG